MARIESCVQNTNRSTGFNKLQATKREIRFGRAKQLISRFKTINTTTAVRATIVAMTPRQHNLVEPRVVGK